MTDAALDMTLEEYWLNEWRQGDANNVLTHLRSLRPATALRLAFDLHAMMETVEAQAFAHRMRRRAANGRVGG